MRDRSRQARPGPLLAALIALAGACSQGADVPAPRQVVVVLLDAARSDRFSCYGHGRETTPELDALAQQGAVFLRHYTQGVNTRTSLPCLFYSRYFTVPIFPFSSEFELTYPEDLLHGIDDEAVSLPEVFRRAGFHTAGISAHSWTRSDTPFAREFDEWHDLSNELPTPTGFPRADVVVERVVEWVRAHRAEDYFLYVHVMDTHFPHFFEEDARAFLGRDPPPLDRFRPDGTVIDITRPLSPEEDAYLDALYDGSLRKTDRALGRLIDELDELGVLDEGLVAVTADHGEYLLEKPRLFEHGPPWHEEVARTPFLLVGRQRVPPGRHDYLTGEIDILPTLAGVMGVSLPEGKHPDGLDLTPFLGSARPERGFIAIDGGILAGNHKAFFTGAPAALFDETRAPGRIQGELYNLASDPEERKDLRHDVPRRWAVLVELYRKELGPLRERYARTKSDKAHQTAFALAPWSFEYEAAPTRGPQDPEALLGDDTLTGSWFENPHWPFLYLVAKGAAGALPLALSIPDGTYLVDLHMKGSVRVRVPGAGEPVEAVAGPVNPVNWKLSESLSIGRVVVQGGRLSIVLEHDAEAPTFYLRSIGFTPEHMVDTSDEERARVERLKQLGY